MSFDIGRLLTSPNKGVRDVDQLVQKLNRFIEGGVEKLMVLADFDYTLTKRWSDVDKLVEVDSSYCVVTKSPLMDESIGHTMRDNYRAGFPLMSDPDISVERKMAHMTQLREEELKLWMKSGLTKSMLRSIINCHNLTFRDNMFPLCASLAQEQVPFIVSTAGLADIVEGVLNKENLLHENISVLGNYFDWKEDGSLGGFKNEIVHSYNKETSMRQYVNERHRNEVNEITKKDLENNNKCVFAGRSNFIVMGDSLGDARMAMEIENIENVVKIGFLNDNDPESLESRLVSYCEAFDLVLINEESLTLPLHLLEAIVKGTVYS